MSHSEDSANILILAFIQIKHEALNLGAGCEYVSSLPECREMHGGLRERGSVCGLGISRNVRLQRFFVPELRSVRVGMIGP